MRCFACAVDFEQESGACRICGRLLETDSDRYFKAGMDAMAAGEIEESIALLEGCLSVDPEHLTGRFNLGVAYSLDDQCDLALEELLAVAEKDPNHPGLFTALGQAAFGSYLYHSEQARAREQQMVQLLTEAIARDPSDVDALFSLGNAYLALERPQEALPYLKRAATVDSQAPAIYFTLAKAFRMMGRYREAVLMAKKSLVISSPEDGFRDEIEELFYDLQEESRATADG